LNSKIQDFTSLDQSAAELWLAILKISLRGQIIPFVERFDFCQILGFWAIILAPVMLESQSMTLKTRMIA